MTPDLFCPQCAVLTTKSQREPRPLHPVPPDLSTVALSHRYTQNGEDFGQGEFENTGVGGHQSGVGCGRTRRRRKPRRLGRAELRNRRAEGSDEDESGDQDGGTSVDSPIYTGPWDRN